MRIFIDDNDCILKQLRKLYYELPFDLRSEKTLIPASELIVEAIEFIACLKVDADFRNNSGEENNNKQQRNEQVLALKTFKKPPPILPKPMAAPPPPPSSTTTAPRPLHSNLNIIRPTSVLQRPQVPSGPLQVRLPQKTFTMMPPRGHAQTVSVQLPHQVMSNVHLNDTIITFSIFSMSQVALTCSVSQQVDRLSYSSIQ